MNQLESKTVYCGIDVSKQTLDVYYLGQSSVFENNPKGFKKLLLTLQADSQCVMEATGPYYMKLAVYLQSHGVKVSVVNPLVIKRFAQMRMLKAKTDKADAKLIALYADREAPSLWQAPRPLMVEIQQEQAVLQGLCKQLRMMKNQLEAILSQPYQSQQATTALKLIIEKVEEQSSAIEASILSKVENIFTREIKLITSIPGIGMKTAIALLVATDAFSRFSNGKQVASYIGICPRIYQSGTSIKGRGSITKMGDARIRTLLYMGACSAKKYNLACKNLYDRLVQNGKAKKLALIAVANKMIRQAYAVVSNNEMYNPEYYFVLSSN